MGGSSYLSELELLVLLALIRLGDEAYGVSISAEIERQTGREPALGSVYATLERRRSYQTPRVGYSEESRHEPRRTA